MSDTTSKQLERPYWCFISYRHADDRVQDREWASWLHQEIERYAVPAELVGTRNSRGDVIPERIYPVFRDEVSLAADADLASSIVQALDQSRSLVVLCSPRTVESKYVAEEVLHFKRTDKMDRIIAAILDGEPGDSQRECFPAPLRHQLGEDGELDLSSTAEPIAADFRLPSGKEGFTSVEAYRLALSKDRTLAKRQVDAQADAYGLRLQLMKLKIIAGIVGVPLERLQERDQAYRLERAQRRTRALRRWLIAIATLSILLIVAGFVANELRIRAATQRDQALRTLSLMHADFSQEQTDQGHATVGVLLALEALPKSLDKPDRPYVPEAEAALHAALDSLRVRRILSGHRSLVTSAVFSPDGARVLTASRDHTARLWDVAGAKELLVLDGHEREVNGAGFSPDGTRAVTASTDRTARLWDLASAKELHVLKGHERAVIGAAFSPDGTQVVTTSADKTARLWDVASGKEVAVLEGHEDDVTNAGFSPDGTRMVTASADNTARLWNLASGNQIAVLEGHEKQAIEASSYPGADGEPVIQYRYQGTVTSAAFSPDGTQVITTSSDKTARLWDVASGEEVAVLRGHESIVTSAGFSPDGSRLVTASGNSARVWDLASAKQLVVLGDHEGWVSSAAFSPDGSRLVTASADNTARVWDLAGTMQFTVLTGHEGGVTSAVFSPDGTRVATTSRDQTTRVWNAQSAKLLAVLRRQSTRMNRREFSAQKAAFIADGAGVLTSTSDTTRVWDVARVRQLGILRSIAAFSPDGSRAVTTTGGGTASDNTARLWDLPSDKLFAVLNGHSGNVGSVGWNDGKYVTAISEVTTTRLWHEASGKELTILKGHEEKVISTGFSPDGTRFVTTSKDNTARLWDVESGKAIAVFNGHSEDVTNAVFSPDGTRVLTVSDDNTARLWDAATGNELAVLKGHSERLHSAAFSPDGTRVVTSTSRTTRMWDVESARQLAVFEAGYSAAFSPDGTRVLTASSDKSARLWDVASGKEVAVFRGHEGEINSARFSPDGTQVVTTSADQTARLWRVASAQALIDTARAMVPRKKLTELEKKLFFVPTE